MSQRPEDSGTRAESLVHQSQEWESPPVNDSVSDVSYSLDSQVCPHCGLSINQQDIEQKYKDKLRQQEAELEDLNRKLRLTSPLYVTYREKTKSVGPELLPPTFFYEDEDIFLNEERLENEEDNNALKLKILCCQNGIKQLKNVLLECELETQTLQQMLFSLQGYLQTWQEHDETIRIVADDIDEEDSTASGAALSSGSLSHEDDVAEDYMTAATAATAATPFQMILDQICTSRCSITTPALVKLIYHYKMDRPTITIQQIKERMIAEDVYLYFNSPSLSTINRISQKLLLACQRLT